MKFQFKTFGILISFIVLNLIGILNAQTFSGFNNAVPSGNNYKWVYGGGRFDLFILEYVVLFFNFILFLFYLFLYFIFDFYLFSSLYYFYLIILFSDYFW
jgi:hypothetical protein